ncbi:Maf family protein [Floccifex sp.]|uniref:Maf family protein n=1 Tax=Floccifex sp. TaxID=2815810 RepID=UPI002A7548D8|nr:Maf family protein [Floccifex sp.]MDD7281683.1 Maf family protein [Erysipelotrichaceae bacterium]MDY2958969.1 Maf family protein [Floccifex sp.]
MIVLASKSPRRKEILSSLGYSFVVCPAVGEEVFDLNIGIDSAIKEVAYHKAKEVQKQYPDDCILAADTIVYYEGKNLGKPKSRQEAIDCLCSLSNHVHEVKTGMCVLYGEQKKCVVSTTKVYFKDLSLKQIIDYVDLNTCYDKAGSYGIQECDFVDHIEGSYSNVMGLDSQVVQNLLIALKR